MASDPILEPPPQLQRRIWESVSRFPLRSLWNLQGIPLRVIAKHTWRSLLDDNLVGRHPRLASGLRRPPDLRALLQ